MTLLRTAEHECRECDFNDAQHYDEPCDHYCGKLYVDGKAYTTPATGIRSDCPLPIGHAEEDCDLTVAYMVGYEKGKEFAKALRKSAETSQAIEEDGDE